MEEKISRLYQLIASMETEADCKESTEEYTRLLINMDTHAPDKIRVNAVLSSIDEFYRLYNVRENDGMYKGIEERVKVW